MDISATSAMQQTQMRKMDGTGGGQGNGAGKIMREMMAELPQEEREVIQGQMQVLNPTDKANMTTQMSEIDTTNKTVDDIMASIMDILKPQEPKPTTGFSVYG